MITNLTQYLNAQNRIRNSKITVKDETMQLSFGELYRFSNYIAEKIHVVDCSMTNEPIVVFCNKGCLEYLSMIGVLYSGNFYVPLDIKMPKERLKLIFSLVNPKIVLTVTKFVDILDELEYKGEKMLIDCLDFSEASVEAENDWTSSIVDTSPAYMLFTSGSTGVPKGVVVSHKAVIDYIEWQCKDLEFDETVVLANQAPFYFDASMPDIYTPLAVGASLVIVPEKLFLLPNKLIDYLNDNKVNTLIWVPSALMIMTNKMYFSQKTIENLRLVMFCGEVMPNKHLNIWRSYYPSVRFINLYGPTEAAYACTYYEVNRKFTDEQTLPIGKPCGNTKIIVLNDDNRLVEEGEEGELCIGGTCLASGYYRNREKTLETFVQNPLNDLYNEIIYRTGDIVKYNEQGELEYVGRKDFQIKHMGYRIELGEIESATYGVSEIESCCAVYDESKSQIRLFCVINDNISEKSIYGFLKTRIPKYMLPGEIIIMKALPHNANGKIDRKYLKNFSLE